MDVDRTADCVRIGPVHFLARPQIVDRTDPQKKRPIY